MPYIKQEDRSKMVFHGKIDTAGELQYVIAALIKGYLHRKDLNYQHCNDVMGALAGAQMEFYRRTVAPYEDEKIEENGDV